MPLFLLTSGEYSGYCVSMLVRADSEEAIVTARAQCNADHRAWHIRLDVELKPVRKGWRADPDWSVKYERVRDQWIAKNPEPDKFPEYLRKLAPEAEIVEYTELHDSYDLGY